MLVIVDGAHEVTLSLLEPPPLLFRQVHVDSKCVNCQWMSWLEELPSCVRSPMSAVNRAGVLRGLKAVLISPESQRVAEPCGGMGSYREFQWALSEFSDRGLRAQINSVGHLGST